MDNKRRIIPQRIFIVCDNIQACDVLGMLLPLLMTSLPVAAFGCTELPKRDTYELSNPAFLRLCKRAIAALLADVNENVIMPNMMAATVPRPPRLAWNVVVSVQF